MKRRDVIRSDCGVDTGSPPSIPLHDSGRLSGKGRTTTYLYDELGRLKTETFEDDDVTYEYHYDELNRIDELNDGTLTYSQQYDELGRTEQITLTGPQLDVVLDLAYDAADRRESLATTVIHMLIGADDILDDWGDETGFYEYHVITVNVLDDDSGTTEAFVTYTLVHAIVWTRTSHEMVEDHNDLDYAWYRHAK